MKTKGLPLMVVLICTILSTSYAQVYLSWQDSDLTVTSVQKADEGMYGCDAVSLSKAIPYVYILERAAPRPCADCEKEKQQCFGAFKEYARLESKQSDALFKNLPEGNYRATCRVAKAEGCSRENGGKSIVYLQTKSKNSNPDDPLPDMKDLTDTPQRLRAFPNPFVSILQLSFESASDQEVTITVTDPLGRVLISRQESIQVGMNSFELDFEDVGSQGMFWVQLADVMGQVYRAQVIRMHN